jgi:hypothetical protein
MISSIRGRHVDICHYICYSIDYWAHSEDEVCVTSFIIVGCAFDSGDAWPTYF